MLGDATVLSEQHRAALAYATDGWRVFPLIPLSKKPMPGSSGYKDATADLGQVEVWWNAEPLAGIGWSPEPCGLCVVDIDGAEGEAAWRALQAEHGAAPETLTIGTPSGGRHLIFAGSLPSTVKRLGPCIDTRGIGGYGVLPPTLLEPYEKAGATHSGAYTWLSAEGIDAAPVPEWIAPLLAKAAGPVLAAPHVPDDPANIARAVEWTSRQPVPLPGHGANDALYRIAAVWRDLGVSASTTADHLMEWSGLGEEYRPVIGNAYAYAQNAPGAHAAGPASITFAGAIPTPAPAPAGRFVLRDEAIQAAAPDIVPLIENFLPDGGTAAIHGPMGSYKSFVATEIAFAVASGKPCFGKLAVHRSGPVIYMAGEGPTGIEKRRWPTLRHAYGITDPLPFYTVRAVPLAREGQAAAQECVDAIRAVLGADVRPGIVILDTKTTAMAGLNEDKAGDAALYLESVTLMAEQLGCLVLTIAHEGLVAGRMRGSTAAAAGIDGNWSIANDTAAHTAILTPSRLKDDDLAPIHLRGRPVGVPGLPKPGLVFDVVPAGSLPRRMNAADADAVEQDLRDRETVELALLDGGFIGEGKAVTTALLAQSMVDRQMGPPKPGDAEARDLRLIHQRDWLTNRSTAGTARKRKPLAGLYHVHPDRGRSVKMWFAPIEAGGDEG